MSNDAVPTPTVSPPASDKLRLKLQLLRTLLGRAHEEGRSEFADPIEFIAWRRRETEDHPVPDPFYTIAVELSQAAGSPVTHETVRRWHRAFTQPVTTATSS